MATAKLSLGELFKNSLTGQDAGWLTADASVDQSGSNLGYIARIVIANYALILDGDTLTFKINGASYVLTARTGAPGTNEFRTQTSNPVTATNLNAAISAYTALAAVLSSHSVTSATVTATYNFLGNTDSITWSGSGSAITLNTSSKPEWDRRITAVGSGGGLFAIVPPASVTSSDNAAISFMLWVLERYYAQALSDATMRAQVRRTIVYNQSTQKHTISYNVTFHETSAALDDGIITNVTDDFSA